MRVTMNRLLAILCILAQSANPLLAFCCCDETGACCPVTAEKAASCCTQKPVQPTLACCRTSKTDTTPDACECCTCCNPYDGALLAITHEHKLRTNLTVESFVDVVADLSLQDSDAIHDGQVPILFPHASHNVRQAWLAVWRN